MSVIDEILMYKEIFYAVGSFIAIILLILKIGERFKPRLVGEITACAATIKDAIDDDHARTVFEFTARIFNLGRGKAIFKGAYLFVKNTRIGWEPSLSARVSIGDEPEMFFPRFIYRGIFGSKHNPVTLELHFLHHKKIVKRIRIPENNILVRQFRD